MKVEGERPPVDMKSKPELVPLRYLITVSVGSLVSVNVQVTSSPALRFTRTPFVIEVNDFAVAVPVRTQAVLVSTQPAGTVSTAS